MNNSNDQFIGYDQQIISSVYLENKYLFKRYKTWKNLIKYE